MTIPRDRIAFLLVVLGALLASRRAPAITIEIAGGGTNYVQVGDTWRYFKGTVDPPAGWNDRGLDDSSWLSGPSGFGYDDGDDATVLTDMAGYLTLYIRKTFDAGVPGDQSLQLVIDYDDGFVAYINGDEVARRHMPVGTPTRTTPASSHDAGTPETIALGRASDILDPGVNVIAIEGHNTSLTSGDFSLIPALSTASTIVRDGASWVVETSSVTLRGKTTAAGAASVQVGGAAAAFNPADGTWEGTASLAAGLNQVEVKALDASSATVDSGTISILYVPPSSHSGGTLPGDAVWSGAHVVDASLTVPAGTVLTIEAGTVVMLKTGVRITVRGRLLANGTEAGPVRFTHYGDGTTWKQIIFLDAEDSGLIHCVFEYADSEGEHQDYYAAGSRDYHEAIVGVATNLLFEGCTFHRLPDASAGAEGDAIAIMSDDPDVPGDATAIVRGCEFLSIGQGIHERFSYVLIEDCYFTGKRGDNDDVDLWGESDPPPMIRNNRFVNPEHDDTINPTRCSAWIVGNLIMGTDDHGLVLRDKASPVVMNNLIIDCANGGIAIENSNTALLVNNTILDCGRGLRLFDLGRWDAPYYLNPGGGTATVINCIIRDCPQVVTLDDSSNTTIADRGSHITVLHSNIEGGQGAISVNGARSTVTWGAGNIDADPLFVNPVGLDYRLKPGSTSIDSGTAEVPPDVDEDGVPPDTDKDGVPRPLGAGFDMGAYEYTDAPPPVRFVRGDSNGDGVVDIADPVKILLHLFAGGGDLPCFDAGDVDDLGSVQIPDAIYLLTYLFLAGTAPEAPHGACGADGTQDEIGCASYPECAGG
jgi:parallel beta-helix repeat protein